MDHHKDTEYDFYLILNLLVTEKMQLQIDKEAEIRILKRERDEYMT